MTTVIYVRRFIAELPPQRVFITRELLTFGSRKSIDWLLCIMVKKEMILRLARGVFVRNDVGMKMPALREIAEAKARAFGKLIIPTLKDLAKKRRLSQHPKVDRRKKDVPDPEGVAQFSVIGSKGNFQTRYGRVTFKSIAPRKFFLHQEKVGKTILAMWHASEDATFCPIQLQSRERFNRQERRRVRELSVWTPAWLHRLLRPEPPQFGLRPPWSIFPMQDDSPSEDNPPLFVQEASTIYVSKQKAREGRRRLFKQPAIRSRAQMYVVTTNSFTLDAHERVL